MQPLKTITSLYINHLCQGRFVLLIPNFRGGNVVVSSVDRGWVNSEAIGHLVCMKVQVHARLTCLVPACT